MRAAKALVLCVGVLLAWPTMSQQTMSQQAQVVTPPKVAPLKGQAPTAVAAREQLTIVSTTQDAEVADLLADFRANHPGIDIVYSKINSNDIYNQIVDPSTSST